MKTRERGIWSKKFAHHGCCEESLRIRSYAFTHCLIMKYFDAAYQETYWQRFLARCKLLSVFHLLSKLVQAVGWVCLLSAFCFLFCFCQTFPAAPSFNQEPWAESTVAVDSSDSFLVSPLGHPPPLLSIFHNGQSLSQSSRIRLFEFTSSSQYFLISSFNSTLAGIYQIFAHNSAGSAQIIYRVSQSRSFHSQLTRHKNCKACCVSIALGYHCCTLG